MHIKHITFQSSGAVRGQDVLLFADDRWRLNSAAQNLDDASDGAITRAVKAARAQAEKSAATTAKGTKGAKGAKGKTDSKDSQNPETVVLNTPVRAVSGSVVVAKLPHTLTPLAMVNLAGGLAARFKALGASQQRTLTIDFGSTPIDKSKERHADLVGAFVSALVLRLYRFDAYVTKDAKRDATIAITVRGALAEQMQKGWVRYAAQTEGVQCARDFANEPSNVLYPEEYAKRVKALAGGKLRVTVLDDKKLAQEQFHALLAVAKGSVRPARVVIMEWHNAKNAKAKPVVFIGKGVTFDSGGISLKPPSKMGDMKFDMAGSAAVVGIMKTLAARKAPVNAVGIIGLVENMPDGGALRPGDIIQSLAGKTIDVQNTDAEGRLVLADLLAYVLQKYEPEVMVDLATLTGAIMVSLADLYGGLMTPNDTLSRRLVAAGEQTGELLWRMPLHEQLDVLMNSEVADMCNIESAHLGAGSSTAAHFLQRFTDPSVPWAHLDIAGVAFRCRARGIHTGVGASGFGVRLLDAFVHDNYEDGAKPDKRAA